MFWSSLVLFLWVCTSKAYSLHTIGSTLATVLRDQGVDTESFILPFANFLTVIAKELRNMLRTRDEFNTLDTPVKLRILHRLIASHRHEGTVPEIVDRVIAMCSMPAPPGTGAPRIRALLSTLVRE